MTITGIVISASVRPPTSGAERGRLHEVEEHRQAEQAEDDRGHRGEIVDRDLDQVGPAVPRRIFLEIERRRARRSGRPAASVTSIVSSEPLSAPQMPTDRRIGRSRRRSGSAMLKPVASCARPAAAAATGGCVLGRGRRPWRRDRWRSLAGTADRRRVRLSSAGSSAIASRTFRQAPSDSSRAPSAPKRRSARLGGRQPSISAAASAASAPGPASAAGSSSSDGSGKSIGS